MTARKHKDFIPPWMDTPTLCAHICASVSTVKAWVTRGILPPPRERGGKLLWKWSEVDAYLSDGPPVVYDGRITANVKKEIEESRTGY